jgi:hypothetical protein
MVATVDPAHLEVVSASEKNGALVELRVAHLVRGLSAATVTPDAWLTEVFAALDTAGYTDNSSPVGHPNLTLTGRLPRIVEKSKTCAMVELQYEHFNHGGYGYIAAIAKNGGSGIVRGSCGIKQQRTTTDRDGTAIEVEYTYPATDPEFAGVTDPPQNAEIDVYLPTDEFTFNCFLYSNLPRYVAGLFVGKLNSTTNWGSPARKLLCTDFRWEMYNLSTNPHQFRAEIDFSHDEKGWDPIARWVDPRTGKPPPDLVEDTGKKTIQYQEAVDFISLLEQYGGEV